jgi:uncharacterized protein (TIRG00374 family)
VVALLVASLSTVYIRAQRWRVLLRPVGDVPLLPVLSATAIGFGAATVLPLRLGEIVRPALLARGAGIGMSAALSSVVLERLFDMLLVIGCFLGVSVAYPIPLALRRGAFALAAAAGLGFVVLLVVQRNSARAEALIGRLLTRLPARAAGSLRPVARAFLTGLGGLSDLWTVGVVLAYSAYLWGMITLTFLFGFLALGTSVPLVAASLATVVIVAAFVFLPQAPGFVGTWQAGCVLALGIFHVPKDVAVGYSLLTWMMAMIANVGAAGVFLAREDVSLGQLLRSGRGAPAAGAER